MATTSHNMNVKSAIPVFEVLEFFDEIQRGASLGEIARRLGYPVSSTSMLLRQAGCSISVDQVSPGAGVVAVSQENGDLAGIVSEDQLSAVPEDQRPYVPLGQLMVPFNKLARADLDEDLSVVLSRLNPRTPVVTVWRDGKLLGVVPKKKLLARMQQASN